MMHMKIQNANWDSDRHRAIKPRDLLQACDAQVFKLHFLKSVPKLDPPCLANLGNLSSLPYIFLDIPSLQYLAMNFGRIDSSLHRQGTADSASSANLTISSSGARAEWKGALVF